MTPTLTRNIKEEVIHRLKTGRYRIPVCGEKAAHLNIYVGNLSLEVTSEELRREFTAFGAVLSVAIMSDRYIGSGQPRGYGFVEMASKSEGDIAITRLQGKLLKSRVISVVEALPLSDKRGNITPIGRKNNKQANRKTRQRTC